MSFVPGTHFYRQKTKYTKSAAKPVPTTTTRRWSNGTWNTPNVTFWELLVLLWNKRSLENYFAYVTGTDKLVYCIWVQHTIMGSKKEIEAKFDRESEVEPVPKYLYWQSSCTGFYHTWPVFASISQNWKECNLCILLRAGESTVMPSCHRQKGMVNFFLPTPRMQSAPRGQFSWGTRPFPPPLYQKWVFKVWRFWDADSTPQNRGF